MKIYTFANLISALSGLVITDPSKSTVGGNGDVFDGDINEKPDDDDDDDDESLIIEGLCITFKKFDILVLVLLLLLLLLS